MKRVFASKDQAAIEIVRGLLAEAGIEAQVFNERTASVLGDVPFFSAMPELWVTREEDRPRALEIVERFESGEARDELPSEPWTCPACGENIEGQFTSCWQCESE